MAARPDGTKPAESDTNPRVHNYESGSIMSDTSDRSDTNHRLDTQPNSDSDLPSSQRFYALNGINQLKGGLRESSSLPILKSSPRLPRTILTRDDAPDHLPRTHVTFSVQNSDEEDEDGDVISNNSTGGGNGGAFVNYANVTLYGSDTEADEPEVPNHHVTHQAREQYQNNHRQHFHPRPRRGTSMRSSKRRTSRRLSVMDFRRDKSMKGMDRRRSSVGGLVSVEDVPEKDLEWLEGDGFLERLESEVDEIDPEILQKGVDSLRSHAPETCRRRMTTVLTGRAFTFVILLVALMDAVAIITQIILDIQASHLNNLYLGERDLHLIDLMHKVNVSPYTEFNYSNSEQLIYHLSVTLGEIAGPTQDPHAHRRKRSVFMLSELLAPTNRNFEKLSEEPGDMDRAIIDDWKETLLHEEVFTYLRRVRRSSDGDTTYQDFGIDLPYDQYRQQLLQLQKISHYLHYTSVALLSFLVAEVFLKFIGFGVEILKHKIEVVDAILVTTSFVLDLVFISEHEKNIPVVIFLFIWQMIRVISALIMQNKKRVEFLLQVLGELNKSMKRQIEKLNKDLEETKQRNGALYELCKDLGANDQIIQMRLDNDHTRSPDTLTVSKLNSLFTRSPIAGFKNMLHASKEALGIGKTAKASGSPKRKVKKPQPKKEEIILTAYALNKRASRVLGLNSNDTTPDTSPYHVANGLLSGLCAYTISDKLARDTLPETDGTNDERELCSGDVYVETSNEADGAKITVENEAVGDGIVNEAYIGDETRNRPCIVLPESDSEDIIL